MDTLRVFDQREFVLLALLVFPFFIWRRRRRGAKHVLYSGLFYIYIAGVITFTLFPIVLDWEWGLAGKTHHVEGALFRWFVWREALLNIVLTLPLGMLYPFLWKHSWPKTTLLAILSGTAIETAQLVLLMTTIHYQRVVDISDVLFNFVGVMLGYIVYRFVLGPKQRSWSRP